MRSRIGLDPDAIAHAEATVVPTVVQILDALGASIPIWEVTIEGLDAIGVYGADAVQGGHSVELPLFLTMLSSALELPLRQDVILTGALISLIGTIGPVGALPAKVQAAREQHEVREFVYPAFGADGSLNVMAPAEAERIEAALAEAREQFHATPVHDVAEALMVAVQELDIPLAILRKGIFGHAVPNCFPESPVRRAAAHLLKNHHERFWSATAAALTQSDRPGAEALLAAFLGHHMREGHYPSGMGKRLMHTLAGLAPLRRRSLQFPLTDFGRCLEVGLLGGTEDAADVTVLLQAVEGRVLSHACVSSAIPPVVSAQEVDYSAAEDTTDLVLSRLSAEFLSSAISRPIDEARLTFNPGFVTSDSWDDVVDVIMSFYVHLMGKLGVTLDLTDRTALEAESLAYLNEAYARAGGIEGAKLEGELGVNGGMRSILDAMADFRKQKDYEKSVLFTFTTAMKGRNDSAREKFVQAVFARFGSLLPVDLCEAPIERFTARWEDLARAIARCLNEMTQTLRRL
ncbi:MAG: hypothetical protein IT365_04465 [Candidatus Hydrogenedentes bacterium]|nr:hypothetical protein [Candidatus Hydrogenedentota bacterium]